MKIQISTKYWDKTLNWQNTTTKLITMNGIWIVILLFMIKNNIMRIITSLILIIDGVVLYSYDRWKTKQLKEKIKNEKRKS